MKQTINPEDNKYGFPWGPMQVIRRAMIDRASKGTAYLLGVKSPYHDLEIYVSETGRSVRVWKDGRELK